MSNKRFRIEKLVRDHIPEIMRNKGLVVRQHSLDNVDFITKLKEKLQEEAKEVKNSKHESELAEELADVLEVVYSLSNAANIPLVEIEKLRLKKLKSKGGFDHKIYIPYVDIEENHPSMEDYLKKSMLYPVVEPTSYKSDCLFCQFAQQEKKCNIIETFTHCFAIQDQNPVSKGHLLIIPKEHTENWFTARDEVREDLMKALHILKDRLDLELCPEGYNIGANCGEVAGQSVMHLHFHLIPRYKGDMEYPKGGVRGVIPSKQNY